MRAEMATQIRLIRRGVFVEYASLAWMSVEFVVSIYSGITAWSIALLAFGGDSLIELLSSATVVRHLRNSLTGSEDASIHLEERRAEWVTALLLLTLIPVIGLAAAYAFFSGIQPESSPLGIAVAIGAVIIMPGLWFEKRRLGAASDCLPLTIDATESATCFLMAVTLLLGLLINYLWRVPWIDYAAAIVILAFVAKEALESVREVTNGGNL